MPANSYMAAWLFASSLMLFSKYLMASSLSSSIFAFIDGIKAKMLDDNEEAIKYFEKSIKLDANNHAAMYELAGIYFKQGDFDQSLKNIKGAVQLGPANK